jgi:hypothetical protein
MKTNIRMLVNTLRSKKTKKDLNSTNKKSSLI